MFKVTEQKDVREKSVIRYGAGELHGFDLTMLTPSRLRTIYSQYSLQVSVLPVSRRWIALQQERWGMHASAVLEDWG